MPRFQTVFFSLAFFFLTAVVKLQGSRNLLYLSLSVSRGIKETRMET